MNPAESVIDATSVHRLRTRWTVSPGHDPQICPIRTVAPVVAGGRMFRLEPLTNQVGAYSAMTGRKLWVSRFPWLEATGLAVAGGKLVVTDVACSARSGGDSNVVALDPATGALVRKQFWAYSTDISVVENGVVVTSGRCSTGYDDYEKDARRVHRDRQDAVEGPEHGRQAGHRRTAGLRRGGRATQRLQHEERRTAPEPHDR